MIRSIISVGGILFFIAMLIYFIFNPATGVGLVMRGFHLILEILGRLPSYLGGLL